MPGSINELNERMRRVEEKLGTLIKALPYLKVVAGNEFAQARFEKVQSEIYQDALRIGRKIDEQRDK